MKKRPLEEIKLRTARMSRLANDEESCSPSDKFASRTSMSRKVTSSCLRRGRRARTKNRMPRPFCSPPRSARPQKSFIFGEGVQINNARFSRVSACAVLGARRQAVPSENFEMRPMLSLGARCSTGGSNYSKVKLWRQLNF
jgi:hypothetical protein